MKIELGWHTRPEARIALGHDFAQVCLNGANLNQPRAPNADRIELPRMRQPSDVLDVVSRQLCGSVGCHAVVNDDTGVSTKKNYPNSFHIWSGSHREVNAEGSSAS
jgi:hypothetical protein